MLDQGRATNRWYVLILSTFTLLLCVAVPTMAMPVLFKEISEELQLNLIQIGTVWSMVPLANLFMVFIGGIFLDRYGVKRVTIMILILAGILGASRGLATNFWSLALSHFSTGLILAIILIAMPRAATTSFGRRQLGLAQGVLATGMGVGFATGALVSASTLSPLLGSWRYVFFLYGAISILIGFLWLFTVREPRASVLTFSANKLSFRQMISSVVRMKEIWIIGFSSFWLTGCIYAVQGYLPLYLREAGWSAISADGTLASLNIAGAAGAIPVAMLSDKLGLRKAVILPAMVIICISSALLTLFDNAIVWLLAILIGIARDVTASLLITMNQENAADSEYSGTALGMQFTIGRAGSVITPPLGNSLASIYARAPFALWSAFAIVGTILMMFVKETGWRSRKAITSLGYDNGAL